MSVQDIIAEFTEACSDLFRAERCLTTDCPTQVEIDLALRAVSDAVQRIDYATDLLRAMQKREGAYALQS